MKKVIGESTSPNNRNFYNYMRELYKNSGKGSILNIYRSNSLQDNLDHIKNNSLINELSKDNLRTTRVGKICKNKNSLENIKSKYKFLDTKNLNPSRSLINFFSTLHGKDNYIISTQPDINNRDTIISDNNFLPNIKNNHATDFSKQLTKERKRHLKNFNSSIYQYDYVKMEHNTNKNLINICILFI
jgi:hypothetical protein